jgi:hypothetical protein
VRGWSGGGDTMRLGLFFVKNNMYYIKIVINNMSSKPRVPSDETIIKCRAIVEKADKSYLGIYGLPIPISVDIQKYIDRHIITANIEMLQKIKSELHLKIRSNGNGRRRSSKARKSRKSRSTRRK